MDQEEKDIVLPSFITPTLLMEFLFIIKNGFNDKSEQIISLIQTVIFSK